MSRGGRRAAGGGRRPGYLYQYHIVSFNNNRQSAEANVLHHMISFAYSFTCKFDTKKPCTTIIQTASVQSYFTTDRFNVT